MKINKYISKYNHNDGTIDRIKYIVIHYVGATGDALTNCKYFATQNRSASAHYFVNFDGAIWQSVEDKDIAWHCGSGGKAYKHAECRNANSIGIELCVRHNATMGWFFEEATVQSAVELVKELMKKYSVPLENVIRHYDVTGKNCPEPFVRDANKWEAFKSALTSNFNPNTWYSDEKGWWYAKSETEWAQSEWLDINHHRFYFNESGYALEGMQVIDGEKYCFETDGTFECALMETDENGKLRPKFYD